MGTRRSYDDACGAAHALDLVGERWALLVARELLLGPKRFTDLRKGLPGISPNVLSQRLDELEQAGVVRRRRYAPPMPAWVYELTEWGHELDGVIRVLGRWGARSPAHNREAWLGTDSVVLSLRTMFDPEAAGDFRGRFEVRLGDEVFRAQVDGAGFIMERGASERPDAVIATEPGPLAALVYDGHDLDAAIADGILKLDGDRAAAQRFLTLFRLPPTATRISATSHQQSLG